MALKTLSSTSLNEFKIRSPSSPEIIYEDKPPKYIHNYLLGAKIGKGSYATVREALDTQTNELVAMKICSKRKLAKIPSGIKTVRKESKILTLLDHPNTIKLIDNFQIKEKDKIYLVMKYVPCGNLEQLIRRNNGMGLPMKQVQSLFRDLLLGLQYLQSLRIIHGDIKPENLLLSSEGRLIISDFGVSRMLRKKKSKNKKKSDPRISIPLSSSSHSDITHTSDLTSDGSIHLSSNDESDEKIVEYTRKKDRKSKEGSNFGLHHPAQGTIAFEPPEVASGQMKFAKCGFELDLWAAGIVLYYLATGRHPFSGVSFLDFMDNISHGVFDELPNDLDPDLIYVIKLMLSVDPKKRPSIAEIFDFPFMTKEFKSKKTVKMVENDSAFVKKKDGKYHFSDKKDQAEQCVIC